MAMAADKNHGVGVADLKNRLSEHLRGVKKGKPVVVMAHGTPVARLVPYQNEGEDELAIEQEPDGDLHSVPLPRKPLASRAALEAALGAVREDRSRPRSRWP